MIFFDLTGFYFTCRQQCCRNSQFLQDECHNYVRVLAKDGPSEVLVCGTNSFEPKCRQYELENDGEYAKNYEFQGQGLSPYDPSHNSTFVRDGDMLYAGTGLIYIFIYTNRKF